MHINEIIKKKGNCLTKDDLIGVRFYGVDILQYALLGLGANYNINLEYSDVIYTDISKISIPDDKDLFQVIEGKNLNYVKMPSKDYSQYNFKEVCLSNTLFPKHSTISPKPELFQHVRNKDISNCQLPTGDYSKVDFTNVDIRGIKINQNTILPNTKEFLQNIKNKNISKIHIKQGNYINWDFTLVNIERSYWGKDVKMPRDKELFLKVKDSSINGCTFINKDLSIYDFKDVDIRNCTFVKCKFPSKNNWIQNVLNKDIQNCIFIDCALSSQDLTDVNIVRCKFKGKTKLKADKNIFVKIKNRSLEGVYVPSGDYREYDFSQVNLNYATFTRESLLPEDYCFLKVVSEAKYIRISKNIKKNIHLYDLSSISIDERRLITNLSDIQKAILYFKNNH